MADIKGISIKIGGDTTALTKALADVNKSSKDIQTELKQVEKLLKLDPKNTELVAQKQKLLADAVENSKAKLEALKKAQKDVDAQFAKGEISEGQYRAFEREVAKAEQELSKFEKQLKNTGISAEQIGKKMTDVGKKMTDVGKDLSMKVTAPIAAVGAASFKMAADLQDAMGAADQIFKDASGSVKAWADGLESYYGIAEGEALTYANTMGAMLQNIGKLSEEEAAHQAQILVQLAGDLAAMFGGTTESAVQALTGALKGNTSMLDNYGMGVNAATIKTKALEMGLHDGKGEMDLAAKQAATLALIMEQTADAQGQAAREAEGASGGMRALTTEIKNLSIDIGEVLLPVLTPLIAKINDIVKKFGELSPEMQKTIVIVAGLAAAIGPILLLLGGMSSGVGAVIAIVTKLAPVIAGATAAVGGLSGAIAFMTGPIGIAVAAITGLIAIGVALYKNWDDLVLFGKKTWTALQVGWASGMESIKKAFSDFGAAIAAKMNEIGSGLIAKWEELKNGIIAKAEALKSGVSAKWDEIKAGIAEKAAAITSDVIAKWEELKNGVIAKVSALKSGVSAKWDEIRANTISKLTEIRDQAITWGKNIIQGLIDGIKSKLGAARDAVGAVGEGIKNKIKSMFDIHSPSRVTYEMGEDITQGLADGINDTAGVAVSAASSLAGQVSSALQQANADLAALQAAAAAARAAAQARNDAINKEGDDAAAGVGVEPSNDPAILGKAQQIYDVSIQVAADLAELDSLIASDPANADKYKEAQKIIYKDFIAAGGLPRYLDPKYANQFNYAYDYIHHGPNSDKYEEDIQIMKAVQSLIGAGGAATVTPGSSVGSAIENAAANLAAKAAAKAQGDAAKAQVKALANQHNQLVYDIRERGVKDYDGSIAAQISSLASQITSLIAQIETLDKQAGIRGWNPPTLEQLYMFATGGIVTKPTMAVIGEAGQPEAVLPLSNLLPMMTDALLGAVATLGGSTSTITNSARQVTLQVINQGTIVGRNGMEEFAKTVSKQISKDFGLAVGGGW